jgi:hypothetical protein
MGKNKGLVNGVKGTYVKTFVPDEVKPVETTKI